MNPKISIIMPIFNAAAFLDDTLCHLKKQTLQDFEIICVDDDSTDHSLSVLQKAAEQDRRIIALHQSHKGAGAARNVGFSYARGEYAIFLDSDDQFSPVLLEKLYAAITEAHAPSTPRNASCVLLSDPSSENEHAITPASLSTLNRSSVTSIPHGASTLRTPRPVACRTSSGRSARVIGSPPVHIIIGGVGPEAMDSITRLHSSVESSPSNEQSAAEARQWRHFIGQRRVTSHASTLGKTNELWLKSHLQPPPHR